jgi:hypothetical protein
MRLATAATWAGSRRLAACWTGEPGCSRTSDHGGQGGFREGRRDLRTGPRRQTLRSGPLPVTARPTKVIVHPIEKPFACVDVAKNVVRSN